MSAEGQTLRVTNNSEARSQFEVAAHLQCDLKVRGLAVDNIGVGFDDLEPSMRRGVFAAVSMALGIASSVLDVDEPTGSTSL